MASPVRPWLVLGLVAAVAAPSLADGPLRYKFAKGQELRYRFDQAMDMSLEIAGRTVDSQLNQQMELTWKVRDYDTATKTATIDQTIDRISIKMTGPGQVIEYDTANKDAKVPENPIAQQMIKVFQAMAGATFTLTMNDQGEVGKVTIPEALNKQLTEAVPALGGASGMFSEEGLKTMSEQTGLKLPKEALKANQTWTNKASIPSPPLGVMVTTQDYTYKNTGTNGIANIAVKGMLQLEPAPDSAVKADVQTKDFTGTIEFDNAKGYLQSSKINQKLVMNVDQMGQKMVQNIDQKVVYELIK